jgi:polar amino acid transport system ATP-binding protein
VNAAPAVLEVQGVTKAYGDVEVLRGIDLAVREHQAVALIGASGSGKSTLLRCIDLLEEIDDGDVLLDGEVITDPAVNPVRARRSLAMVFQAFNLFPHLTVLENVLLARFGLGDRERDYPYRLSGGQQQRVATGPPLRRPAAARGDRARARHAAARAAARRDNERARSRAGG